MKNFKTLLLIAVLTLGAINVANAQKIAHIDARRVVANMSETRALNADLEKLAKSTRDDLNGLIKKFQDLQKKYQEEAPTQTEDTNNSRGKELMQEEQRIKALELNGRESIQEKTQKGFEPIQEKAFKAIEEVANAKGILYVLDASSLLVKKGEDLYDAVKAKLGLLKDLPAPKRQQ